jgi:hypothetical protein
MARESYYSPAKTYTLEDFVQMKITDEMTYYNFSVIEVIDGVEHTELNILDEYIDELRSICVDVELSKVELNKYRHNPDLLAFDVYKSAQLDFVILAINDMYDPKEFDKAHILLPPASKLRRFLDIVYSKEAGYLNQSRIDNNIPTYL